MVMDNCPTNFGYVGQGPTLLAVDADVGCFDVFPLPIVSLFFLPLFETETLSQRALNSNFPTNCTL